MSNPCHKSSPSLNRGVCLANAGIRSCALELTTIDLTFTNNMCLRFHPTDPEVLELLAQQNNGDSEVPDDLFTRMANSCGTPSSAHPK